jgi:hypothetical protein
MIRMHLPRNVRQQSGGTTTRARKRRAETKAAASGVQPKGEATGARPWWIACEDRDDEEKRGD